MKGHNENDTTHKSEINATIAFSHSLWARLRNDTNDGNTHKNGANNL